MRYDLENERVLIDSNDKCYDCKFNGTHKLKVCTFMRALGNNRVALTSPDLFIGDCDFYETNLKRIK